MNTPNQNIQTIPIPVDCKQQVFNIVTKHLLTQNKRATNDGECQYLSEDGLMCAVGCLIRSDLYKLSFESTSLSSHKSDNDSGLTDVVMQSLGWHVEGLTGDYIAHFQQKALFINMIELLTTMQYMHDNEEPADWLQELTQIAIQHSVEMPDMD